MPVVSLVVLGINVYSLVDYIFTAVGPLPAAYVGIGFLLFVYFLFVGYLVGEIYIPKGVCLELDTFIVTSVISEARFKHRNPKPANFRNLERFYSNG